MKQKKLLLRAINSPNGLGFAELQSLAEAFGFELIRTSGSHHIFRCRGVPELLNLQNVQGSAKAYQVRQLLQIVETYNLQLGDAS